MQGTVAGEALLVDYPALLEPVGYRIVASAGMIRQLFTRVGPALAAGSERGARPSCVRRRDLAD